jgi:hypothetical protein
MRRWLKSSTVFALCVNAVGCAAKTSPASAPAVVALPEVTDDMVPMAHEGRVGVWIEEQTMGDILAGVVREVGAERVNTEHEKIAREIAEDRAKQIEAANQPWRAWLIYGVPTGLGALLVGLVAGFFIGAR